jgi:hypothetical protein
LGGWEHPCILNHSQNITNSRDTLAQAHRSTLEPPPCDLTLMLLQFWNGRHRDLRANVLHQMNSKNWDVVSVCILFAGTTAKISELGSAAMKSATLVNLATAAIVARYLRTHLRETGHALATLDEWHKIVRTLKIVDDDNEGFTLDTPAFQLYMLTQNVGKLGNSLFTGGDRGYCLADALFFLYWHEIQSATTLHALRILDAAAANEGVCRWTPPWWRSMIWVIIGRATKAKSEFLVNKKYFFKSAEEAAQIGLLYRGDVGDNVTSESSSKQGLKNGTTARTFETLVPIFALFESHNEQILEASRPPLTLDEEVPDLYSTWNDLQPALYGKKPGYMRKNILEPINDAFGNPFPAHITAGPGTLQLLADCCHDTTGRWANLGNCGSSEVKTRRASGKMPKQSSAATLGKMEDVAIEVAIRMPTSISFTVCNDLQTLVLPAFVRDPVKIQEQICQLRHGLGMVFKGGDPPKKHLHARFQYLLGRCAARAEVEEESDSEDDACEGAEQIHAAKRSRPA